MSCLSVVPENNDDHGHGDDHDDGDEDDMHGLS